MLKPEDTEITQIAVIVDDIDRALAAYCRVFEIDERPTVQETASAGQTQIRFRGATTPARAKLAFLRFRNITLELIEPIDRPSVWGEVLDDKGSVGHHIAFGVQGMQEAVDTLGERGATLVQTGEYTGGRYAYLDTRAELGLDIELLEND
jgi:4-hydroxyphenylpyruvate dioxygenase-like putative hemolysin